MRSRPKCGFLVLDRKGEYIEDTEDQQGTVLGLQHHPMARERMIVVSVRDLSEMKREGHIYDYRKPEFKIQDIEPMDLADFLPGLTDAQAELIRAYAFIDNFYGKVLAETHLGRVDRTNWYKDFEGLMGYNQAGRILLKQYEQEALEAGRDELTEEQRMELEIKGGAGGSKTGVLEHVIQKIKWFCNNPFFGNSSRGREILRAPSCVQQILEYLSQGKCVFIDMRGRHDDEYTLVAALFARRLLKENKQRSNEQQIRACLVMEEAHNILSEKELIKGGGRGSVFVELAREGRSFKLGFILVTQQPDAQSIAPQVVRTIDTVVAFNMQPDDARHLSRLKPAFADLELQIANAAPFQGVAVKNGGPILFQSKPVDVRYMTACARGWPRAQEDRLAGMSDGGRKGGEVSTPSNTTVRNDDAVMLTVQPRLVRLSKARQDSIQSALATMRVWREDDEEPDGTDEDIS